MFTVKGCRRSTKAGASSTTRCLGNSTAAQKNPKESGAQMGCALVMRPLGKEID